MSFGLYVHIPFCEQRCHYCAFAVNVAPESAHAPYVARVIRELRLAGLNRPPRTIYLGGGTPSLLGPELMAQILNAVGPIGNDAEVTIEANPGTLSRELLEAWRTLGINRVSLGAQSFDETDLSRAGRLHSSRETIGDCELLEREGFANVNLDLIAGLPGQERAGWLGSLDWIERLAPEHVSVYLLEAEDSTLWARRPPSSKTTDDDFRWFYEAAADRLGALGYRHYEVSNWARPGYECRHNQGYWNGEAYRGVGLGAHSFVGEDRFWNTRSMAAYADFLDRGQIPLEGSETLTRRTRLEEAFLLGLRQMTGFDVEAVARKLEFQYPQEWYDRVGALEAGGLVHFEQGILKLARGGWLVASGITDELLCPELLSISEATP